jgi:hypothetical protein
MPVTSTVSRRHALNLLLQAPLAILVVGSTRVRAESCGEFDDESGGLRTSLHYVEAAESAQQTCAGCAFFTAPASGACGQCQIFNGPANAGGHCDSWSAKKP